MSVRSINQDRDAARALPRLVPGAVVWSVPIRWWDEDARPERARVITGTLCNSVRWGGDPVYLFHSRLFHREQDARAEMAARVALMAAESDADTEEIVRRSLAGENWVSVLLEVADRDD